MVDMARFGGPIIREVWAANLDKEMSIIREVVDKFNYVAVDTEFPGIVGRPHGTFQSHADYHYQSLRCNVDCLKLIQLGITFSDKDGNHPREFCTWQFNFKFNLSEDMYSQESIDLLSRSGIDFRKFDEHGIDPQVFGELFTTSGVVLNEDIRWTSFHGAYDFAYLLKLLIGRPLPTEHKEFFELLKIFFPTIYDMKFMMKFYRNLKGGLNDLAQDLQVDRYGPQHQAGSDSLLTSRTFFKFRNTYFDGGIDDSNLVLESKQKSGFLHEATGHLPHFDLRFEGVIYGLGLSAMDVHTPPSVVIMSMQS